MTHEDVSFSLHTLKLGHMENFVYLIADHRSRQAAVVDPAWEVEKVIDFAQQQGLQITDVLLTHSHSDHVNGLTRLLGRCHATVHLSEAEANFWGRRLETAVLHHDGDIIHLGDTDIKVWHTPGHTPGSLCFYLKGHILTGDTLFVFGCGRCDLEGGDPAEMYKSLARLGTELPPETIVHPGHHYATQMTSTIAEELKGNPFMRFKERDRFTDYRLYQHDKERQTPYTAVG